VSRRSLRRALSSSWGWSNWRRWWVAAILWRMVAMSTRAGAEQILGADELTAMAVLQAFNRSPEASPVLPTPGAYLFAIYSGLESGRVA
jgi:hypothetical protein